MTYRLEHSLHNHIFIRLDKVQAEDKVRSPWATFVKTGIKTKTELFEDVPIEQVYDATVGQRFLILGAPGSGKTTTLLNLAKVLVERATEDSEQKIPVLLNLSSWKKDDQSIHDWILDNLKFKYGIRRDIGKKWLDEKVILPLLDGLDELEAARQDLCIQKVNEFLSDFWQVGEVVVCSRKEEYELQQSRFVLNGAIVLQPLTEAKIKDFICRTEGEVLWDSVSGDAEILELAKSPLFLDVIVLAWQEISFEEWHKLETSEARQAYLWEAYINRMLAQDTCNHLQTKAKKKRLYPKKKILHWLRWLAWILTKQQQTELFLENLQLRSLGSRASFILYGLLTGSFVGLCLFPFIGLITFRFIESALICLTLGIFLGLLHASISYIKLRKLELLLLPFTDTLETKIAITLVAILKYVEKITFRDLTEITNFSKNPEIKRYESILFSGKKILILLKRECYTKFIFLLFSPIPIFACSYLYSIYSLEIFKFLFLILLVICVHCIINIYFGIVVSTIDGLRGPEIEYRVRVNQGITQSRQKTCIVSLLISVFLTFSLFAFYFLLVYFSPISLMETSSLIQIGFYTFSFNFLYVLFLCSLDLIKYLALRICLYLQNNMSWNYATFLDYCTDRLFLQRVGGGYRFIHRNLQEHLAAQYEASFPPE